MSSGDFLCLDVGSVRIGLARANSIAKIAEPLGTIANDEQSFSAIAAYCKTYNANLLVVGLPQNSNGIDTQQTKYTRQFAQDLQAKISTLPSVVFHDEALSSQKAERLIKSSGDNKLQSSGVDAVAAMIILQDYIDESLIHNSRLAI